MSGSAVSKVLVIGGGVTGTMVSLALSQKGVDVVLVERFVAGIEVNVGILDGRALGAIEVVPKKGIYDYEAKYTPGMTEYFMPARLSSTRTRGVLNLAVRAASARRRTGPCRVDLLVTKGENEYVLEVNTLPGMTPTSLLPKIALEAGYSFAELCEAIVERATLGQATPESSVSEHSAPAAHEAELALAVTSLERAVRLKEQPLGARARSEQHGADAYRSGEQARRAA